MTNFFVTFVTMLHYILNPRLYPRNIIFEKPGNNYFVIIFTIAVAYKHYFIFIFVHSNCSLHLYIFTFQRKTLMSHRRR